MSPVEVIPGLETVVSSDGTTIAFRRTGNGPPLVLLHGTGRDRSHWARVLPKLSRHATVFAIDRRGRGGSGDAVGYEIEREVEDAIAVIEAIGAPVFLLGHSYGAIIALEVAIRIDRLLGLVLYEPPFTAGTDRVPFDLADRIEVLLASGKREAALLAFLVDAARYPAMEITVQRARRDWPSRLSTAHTLSRELRQVNRYTFDPVRFADSRVTCLLLLGSRSPDFFRHATEQIHKALPDSDLVLLPEQGHNAMDSAPALLSASVLSFFAKSLSKKVRPAGG